MCKFNILNEKIDIIYYILDIVFILNDKSLFIVQEKSIEKIIEII